MNPAWCRNALQFCSKRWFVIVVIRIWIEIEIMHEDDRGTSGARQVFHEPSGAAPQGTTAATYWCALLDPYFPRHYSADKNGYGLTISLMFTKYAYCCHSADLAYMYSASVRSSLR